MRPLLLGLAALLAVGCAAPPADTDVVAGVVLPAPDPVEVPTEILAGAPTEPPPAAGIPTEMPAWMPAGVIPPPDWLGTRVLPPRPDGFGEIQPTPPELADRRLATIDLLPPPAGDDFVATVDAVPADVAARSTWTAACPVALEDLRYVTVAFWGFDERPHTGELLVHAAAADGVVEVFRRLHEARFPMEEMRVTTPAELDAPPTGDGNNTAAFVCRDGRGTGAWSQHAYGLAVDINPFHNPYVKGEVVLPELAGAYVDRADHRPGMIQPGDVVTQAFADLGWGWGGAWRSLKDWMHFSANGR
jgi:hypothetical protein